MPIGYECPNEQITAWQTRGERGNCVSVDMNQNPSAFATQGQCETQGNQACRLVFSCGNCTQRVPQGTNPPYYNIGAPTWTNCESTCSDLNIPTEDGNRYQCQQSSCVAVPPGTPPPHYYSRAACETLSGCGAVGFDCVNHLCVQVNDRPSEFQAASNSAADIEIARQNCISSGCEKTFDCNGGVCQANMAGNGLHLNEAACMAAGCGTTGVSCLPNDVDPQVHPNHCVAIEGGGVNGPPQFTGGNALADCLASNCEEDGYYCQPGGVGVGGTCTHGDGGGAQQYQDAAACSAAGCGNVGSRCEPVLTPGGNIVGGNCVQAVDADVEFLNDDANLSACRATGCGLVGYACEAGVCTFHDDGSAIISFPIDPAAAAVDYNAARQAAENACETSGCGASGAACGNWDPSTGRVSPPYTCNEVTQLNPAFPPPFNTIADCNASGCGSTGAACGNWDPVTGQTSGPYGTCSDVTVFNRNTHPPPYNDMATCQASTCVNTFDCDAGTCTQVDPRDPAGANPVPYADQAACEASACGRVIGCTAQDAAVNPNTCQDLGLGDDISRFRTVAECQAQSTCENPYICQDQGANVPNACTQVAPADVGGAQTFSNQADCNAAGCGTPYYCDESGGLGVCTINDPQVPGETSYAAQDDCAADGCGTPYYCQNTPGAQSVCTHTNPGGGAVPSDNLAACTAAGCGLPWYCDPANVGAGRNTCTQNPSVAGLPEFFNEQDCIDSGCGNGYNCVHSAGGVSQCTQVPGQNPEYDNLAECDAANCGDLWYCNAGAGANRDFCSQTNPGGGAPSFFNEQECQDSGCANGYTCAAGVGADNNACTKTDSAAPPYANLAACEAANCSDDYYCDETGGLGVCSQTNPNDGSPAIANEAACDDAHCGNIYYCDPANDTCTISPDNSLPAGLPANHGPYNNRADCQTAGCGDVKYVCEQGDAQSEGGCTEIKNQGTCGANEPNCYGTMGECQASGCDASYTCQLFDNNNLDGGTRCTNVFKGPSAGVQVSDGVTPQLKIDAGVLTYNTESECINCGAADCCNDRYSCVNNAQGDPTCTNVRLDPSGEYNSNQQCIDDGCETRFICENNGAGPNCVVAPPGTPVIDSYPNIDACQADCPQKFGCMGTGANDGSCVRVSIQKAMDEGHEPGHLNQYGVYMYDDGGSFADAAQCSSACKFDCDTRFDPNGDIGTCIYSPTGRNNTVAACEAANCGKAGFNCDPALHECEEVYNVAPEFEATVTNGILTWNAKEAAREACQFSGCENVKWQCDQQAGTCTSVDLPIDPASGIVESDLYEYKYECDDDCPREYACELDGDCELTKGARSNPDINGYVNYDDCVQNCTWDCEDSQGNVADVAGESTCVGPKFGGAYSRNTFIQGETGFNACQNEDKCGQQKAWGCDSSKAANDPDRCVAKEGALSDTHPYLTKAECLADCPNKFYCKGTDSGCHSRASTQISGDTNLEGPGYDTIAECETNCKWNCTPSGSGDGSTNTSASPQGGAGGSCTRSSTGSYDSITKCTDLGRCGQESAVCSSFDCIQRWDVPIAQYNLEDQYSSYEECRTATGNNQCERRSWKCEGEAQDPNGVDPTPGTCTERNGPIDPSTGWLYSSQAECEANLCGKFGAECDFTQLGDQNKQCMVSTGSMITNLPFNNQEQGHDSAYNATQECLNSDCQTATYECESDGDGGSVCTRYQDAVHTYNTLRSCQDDGCGNGNGSWDCVLGSVTQNPDQSKLVGKCTFRPDENGAYSTKQRCEENGCGAHRTNCVQDQITREVSCERAFDGKYPQADGDVCDPADGGVCDSSTMGWRCEYNCAPDENCDPTPGSGVWPKDDIGFVVDWDNPGPATYLTRASAEHHCKYRCHNINNSGPLGDPSKPITNACEGPFPNVIPPNAARSPLFDTVDECNAAGACHVYKYECEQSLDGNCQQDLEDTNPQQFDTSDECETSCGATCSRIDGTCTFTNAPDQGDIQNPWYGTLSGCNAECADNTWLWECDASLGRCAQTPNGIYGDSATCEDNCHFMCNPSSQDPSGLCVPATRLECDQAAQQPGGDARICYDDKAACDTAVANSECEFVAWCAQHAGPNGEDVCDSRVDSNGDPLGEVCISRPDRQDPVDMTEVCKCPPNYVRSEYKTNANGDLVPDENSKCIQIGMCVDDPQSPFHNCVHGTCTPNAQGIEECVCASGDEPGSAYGSYGWLQEPTFVDGKIKSCVIPRNRCNVDEYIEPRSGSATRLDGNNPDQVGKGAVTGEGGVGDDRQTRCKICRVTAQSDCQDDSVVDRKCSGTGETDTSYCRHKYVYCGDNNCITTFRNEPAQTDADYEDLGRCSHDGRTGSEPGDAGSRASYNGARDTQNNPLYRYVNNGGPEDIDLGDNDNEGWRRAVRDNAQNGAGGYLNYYRFLVANQKMNICKHTGTPALCPGDPNCV
jgi:hypothetical protein